MSFKSFTIIEVLVAITVLLIVVFLPLGIISRVLVDNAVTKERIDARYRAQEIIEYVRQKRDTNFMTNADGETYWLEGFYDSANGNWDCRISDCKVLYDETDKFITGFEEAETSCTDATSPVNTLRIKVDSTDKLETTAIISVCTYFNNRGTRKPFRIEETIYRWIRSKDI